MISIMPAAKRFASRYIPGIRILLYHRVGLLNNDPQLLSVTPDHFREQLEILRRNFKVMDLEEAITANMNLSDLGKLIIITFDDGYADNLYQAKPALESYEMPATVFVSSGHTGLTQEFWWDDLARIFLVQPVLPEEFKINIRKKDYCWKIEDSPDLDSTDFRWNVLSQKEMNSRQIAYTEIAQLIKQCSYPERKEIMDSIYQWARLDSAGRQDFRAMDENELRLLVRDGLIKIGSHTKHHVALSAIGEELQYREISESKKMLEEVLAKKVTLFSYPYGQKKDYNKTTIEILKRLDFHLACSNFPGRVYRITDRFQLPRILIRDWDGDTFQKVLLGW